MESVGTEAIYVQKSKALCINKKGAAGFELITHYRESESSFQELEFRA